MHSVLTRSSRRPPAGQAPANPIMQFLPFVLIAVVFYLVFFRPQQKQVKKHQEFVGALKKGDEVVTQGGIIGKVFQVEDKTVTLDVGGGNKVRVVKGQVAGAVEGRPGPAGKAKAKK